MKTTPHYLKQRGAKRPPPCYPRRTVFVNVGCLRQNSSAIVRRADQDKLVITRCGKPYHVIMRHDYFEYLLALARAAPGVAHPAPPADGPAETFAPAGNNRGRTPQQYKDFEFALEHALSERVRADEQSAIELWSALADIAWISPGGEEVTQSYRRAGEIVAAITKEGDYITWYCSGEPGQVAPWIERAMATQGWSWRKR